MKIYLVHSTAFDYENLLYVPLRKSTLWEKHEFILPHIAISNPTKSKELIKSNCDLVIAEVSYPSTGMGIELGWADIHDIPVLCLHREYAKISSSLKLVFRNIVQYSDEQDMIVKIEQWLCDF